MERTKRKSKLSTFFETRFHNVDMFKTGINFKEDGHEQYYSYIGVASSFIIIIITFIYGADRFNGKLLGREQANYETVIEENYFKEEILFGHDTTKFKFGAIGIREAYNYSPAVNEWLESVE